MKLTYSLILAAASCGLAFAAATAYTTPVGYLTSTIGPNVAGSTEGAATFIASSLVLPASFAGDATVSPSGGTVITFTGGVPTGLDATSMLEISNGAQEGWWSSISSSTATAITIANSFPASLNANVHVTVRKFTTVQDVFGNNAPGIAPYSNILPFDNIQVLNPLDQSTATIIYAGGWQDFVTESPAATVIIYPGTAVKVIHRANTSLPVLVSGEVKTTKTQVDLYPNDNWLGQPNPTGGTFGSMQLGTQVLATDYVNIIQPDAGTGQATDTFVSVGGAMYNFVTEAPADTQPVAEGNGYLITRGVGTASILTIPAQAIAP